MHLKKKNQTFLALFIVLLLACTVLFVLTEKDKNKRDITPQGPSEIGVTPFEGIPVINDNRGVPILCYHHVSEDNPSKSSIVVTKEKFREHIKTLKDNGYTTLTMSQLNDYLFNNKPIPEKSVMITFDDGYDDNYSNAFPILKEFNMNATIFVISALMDTPNYLTSSQVKELSDYGIDIQSHTANHADLITLSYEDQLKEFTVSKETLEKTTGKPIISIAYPLGHFNEDSKKAALKAGYSMGFTIDRGYADRDDNPFELNRICIDYTYKPSDLLKVLKKLPK
ncbi:MAG TPA: polysaccharide deacetylase family protein [Clostridium sp.]